jgi:hypothetical protein
MSNREGLNCLYQSINGKLWFNQTNWLSEKPISKWYGVTIDEAGHAKEIHLNNNRLEGVLPEDSVLKYFHSLKVLALSSNIIHGSIPSSIKYFYSLTCLDLSWNRLTGEIPTELEYLLELKILRLDNNLLSGKLPNYLNKFKNLRCLNLSNNQFEGIHINK